MPHSLPLLLSALLRSALRQANSEDLTRSIDRHKWR